MERGRNRECGRRSGDFQNANECRRDAIRVCDLFAPVGRKEGGRVLREIIPRLASVKRKKMETAQETQGMGWGN